MQSQNCNAWFFFSIVRPTTINKPIGFDPSPQQRGAASSLLQRNGSATPSAVAAAAATKSPSSPSPLTIESPSVVQPAVQQPSRAAAAQQPAPVVKLAAATAVKTTASASPFVSAPLVQKTPNEPKLASNAAAATAATAAAATAAASAAKSHSTPTPPRTLAPLKQPPPAVLAAAAASAAAASAERAAAAREAQIAGRLAGCGQFHFPQGRTISRAENDATRERARHLFSGAAAQLEYRDVGRLASCIGLAAYAKRPLYEACRRLSGVSTDETPTPGSATAMPPLTFAQFAIYWRAMTASAHDEAARFIWTLAAAATGDAEPRKWLVREDFAPLLLDIIHTYSGLSFLVCSTQFHSRYASATFGQTNKKRRTRKLLAKCIC